MILDKEIRKFWLWLEKNDTLIRKVLDEGSEVKKRELTNYFDTKILGLGRLSWEINEGEFKRYALVISPNRDFELLKLTKRIIKAAPKLDHWEFHHAKKENPSPESFKLYDNNLDPVIINPYTWTVKLSEKTVTVSADELENIDQETRDHAMDLVVTALYGEEFRILQIDQIIFESSR
jgi:hypothetical protein